MIALFFVAVVYQKRLKKERRARKRLQEQLDLEIKRRTQLEEALKATGASSEQVRAITENVTAEARTSSEPPEASPVHSQSQQQSSQQQPPQQPLQQQQAAAQQYREAQVPRPSQQPSTPEKPAWGYGLDLIGSQASAFWQNYQESLVQELELERKSRQHQAAERDQVKSPLQGIRTPKCTCDSLLFQSRGRVTTRTPFCLRVRPRRGRTTADGGSRQIGQIVQRAAEASDRSDKAESAIRNHESGLTQREANVKKRNRDGRPREEMHGIRRGRAKLRVMISRE
ncbi:hypothetical protein ALC57_06705 [Trachymyrmex cornetzi]|uniref:Dachshund like protein 1 n=1 Tax=Trachymyrmex cornetzi TaxID=471704 RepID=A0A195E7I9_9HYME|nr:hypothetical protein ALC57_06705 [Trachymyrmex cornetzi]